MNIEIRQSFEKDAAKIPANVQEQLTGVSLRTLRLCEKNMSSWCGDEGMKGTMQQPWVNALLPAQYNIPQQFHFH